MVKRLISADVSDIIAMSAQELKQSIRASDGRTLLSENYSPREPWVDGVTNGEIAAAFGVDLILLNGIDVNNVIIHNLPQPNQDPIKQLKDLCGRPVGINLEPVDETSDVISERMNLQAGRRAVRESLVSLDALGCDFVCLTGNPGTGVSNEAILSSVAVAKEVFSGLVIAGKMHSAGLTEPVVTQEWARKLIDQGADIVLVPAIGTVPGVQLELITDIVNLCHEEGALVMSAIGTSQESADIETIKFIALQNKIAGVDIQHIGDAGYGGLAPVENIYEMSKAIRGLRHTVGCMARSIKR